VVLVVSEVPEEVLVVPEVPEEVPVVLEDLEDPEKLHLHQS